MLFINIHTLVLAEREFRPNASGAGLKNLPTVQDAWLLTNGEFIADFGPMTTCPTLKDEEMIDVAGGMIFPAWCDSHTHIVFAAPREQEFVMRIQGLTYQEIAARGGGILNSARRLRDMPEDELFDQALERLREVMRMGTGAIEIKSGYGLTLEAELKMLRVARRLGAETDVLVRTTLLGAHALPPEFKEQRADYIRMVCEEMIPAAVAENLADYVDVFCETNYFMPSEMEAVILAGQQYGLPAKVHVNQFTSIGGIQTAALNGARSVDHLEIMTNEDIAALVGHDTIPTLLPSCSFFLRIPYAPARKLVDAGLPIALASDYNPGSTPSGRMPFVVSLACIQMQLTPEEAIQAATLNGAAAMGVADQVGSISPGKRANFFITRPIPSIAYLPYAFGSDIVKEVILNGRMQQP